MILQQHILISGLGARIRVLVDIDDAAVLVTAGLCPTDRSRRPPAQLFSDMTKSAMESKSPGAMMGLAPYHPSR